MTVLNKIDLVNRGFLKDVKSRVGNNFIPISADSNINIDALKQAIYQRLDLIRIYLRRKTGETDYEEPLIIRNGSNVGTVCNKIHRKMAGILNTPKYGEEAQNLVVRRWGSITPWWTKMF